MSDITTVTLGLQEIFAPRVMEICTSWTMEDMNTLLSIQRKRLHNVLRNQPNGLEILDCVSDCEQLVRQAALGKGSFWEDRKWFAIVLLAECFIGVATIMPKQAEEALTKARELLLPVPTPGIDIDIRNQRHRLLSTAGITLGQILIKKGDTQGALEQVLLAKHYTPTIDLGSLESLVTHNIKQKIITLSFVSLSGEILAKLRVRSEWTSLDIRVKLNEYVPPGAFVQHLVVSGNRISDTDTVDKLGLSTGECVDTIICNITPGVYEALRLKYLLELGVDGFFCLTERHWGERWKGRLEQGSVKFDGEGPENISLSLDPEDGSLWIYVSYPKESIFRLKRRTDHDLNLVYLD